MKVLALLSMVLVVTASPLCIDSKTDIEPVPMKSSNLFKQKIIDILTNNLKDNPLSENRKRHFAQYVTSQAMKFVNCLFFVCGQTVHLKPVSGLASIHPHHQHTAARTTQPTTTIRHYHSHGQNQQSAYSQTNPISSQGNPSSGQVNPSGGQIIQPAAWIPVNGQQSAPQSLKPNSQQSSGQAPNPNTQQSAGQQASTNGQAQNTGGQNPSGQSGSSAQSLATGNTISIQNNYGVISFGK